MYYGSYITVASVVITKRQKIRLKIDRILNVVIYFLSFALGLRAISSRTGLSSTLSKSFIRYASVYVTGYSINRLTVSKVVIHLDFFLL